MQRLPNFVPAVVLVNREIFSCHHKRFLGLFKLSEVSVLGLRNLTFRGVPGKGVVST